MTTFDNRVAHNGGCPKAAWPDLPCGCPPAALEAQTVDNLLAELEATTEITLTTQDELLTALDELLDNALHSDECYIDPEATTCVCVIGKVRAALPRCEARAVVGHWICRRNAHPASPDRHEFGAA